MGEWTKLQVPGCFTGASEGGYVTALEKHKKYVSPENKAKGASAILDREMGRMQQRRTSQDGSGEVERDTEERPNPTVTHVKRLKHMKDYVAPEDQSKAASAILEDMQTRMKKRRDTQDSAETSL